MSVRDDVGRSEATEIKDVRFRTCCQLWGQWVKAIWKKYKVEDDYVAFYDLYGGPGIADDGRLSLCMSAHRMMEMLDIQHRIFAFEVNDTTWNQLYNVTQDIDEITAIQGDHNKCLPDYLLPEREKPPEWDQYGLIMIDPTGVSLEGSIATTMKILNLFPRMDVVVNISARNYKRPQGAYDWPPVFDQLHKMKPQWLVTDAAHIDTSAQWFMAIGMQVLPRIRKPWLDAGWFLEHSQEGEALKQKFNESLAKKNGV